MRADTAQGNAVSVSDQQLISAAIAGDRQAFGELYSRHVRKVFGFLARCTGNEAETEDLVQDVFVQAWRRLASFRSESAFGTWLISIAISIYRSSRRSAARRRRRDHEWQYQTADPAGSGLSPEEQIDLELAIQSLPERARVVVVLHQIHGYRHAEIASLMGISEGASKAHLHRARRLLHRRLGR
jgi:RNA polymerase sigma-70 factor (ECF subfamily)